MALSDTVDAANALLDLHGVPRQVEVDQPVGRLQVEAFSGSVGTDENVDLAAHESVLDLFPIHAYETAALHIPILATTPGVGADQHPWSGPLQARHEITERVIEAREDDGLLDATCASDPAPSQDK